MKYERPDLEELDLELEGSFLDSSTSVEKGDGDVEDDSEWG